MRTRLQLILKWSMVATCILAGTLSLIGCDSGNGGSGKSAATASEELTKAAFIKRANAICKQGLAEKDDAVHVGLEELADQGGSPSQDELVDFAAGALPPFRSMIKQLSQLSPPASDREVVRDFSMEFQKALKKTEANPAILLDQDPFKQASAGARTYGITACTL